MGYDVNLFRGSLIYLGVLLFFWGNLFGGIYRFIMGVLLICCLFDLKNLNNLKNLKISNETSPQFIRPASVVEIWMKKIHFKLDGHFTLVLLTRLYDKKSSETFVWYQIKKNLQKTLF